MPRPGPTFTGKPGLQQPVGAQCAQSPVGLGSVPWDLGGGPGVLEEGRGTTVLWVECYPDSEQGDGTAVPRCARAT